MNSGEIDRALTKMTHEILEKNKRKDRLVFVGIKTGGVHLSARLAEKVRRATGREVPRGAMDITLYRDDLSRKGHAPMVKKTEISFSINDKVVILVDDVLYTGRTIRAAMDALMDIGRSCGIQLAVLVDRGHRELPIMADYVGKTVGTAHDDRVDVLLTETGSKEDAVMVRKTHGAEK